MCGVLHNPAYLLMLSSELGHQAGPPSATKGRRLHSKWFESSVQKWGQLAGPSLEPQHLSCAHFNAYCFVCVRACVRMRVDDETPFQMKHDSNRHDSRNQFISCESKWGTDLSGAMFLHTSSNQTVSAISIRTESGVRNWQNYCAPLNLRNGLRLWRIIQKNVFTNSSLNWNLPLALLNKPAHGVFIQMQFVFGTV